MGLKQFIEDLWLKATGLIILGLVGVLVWILFQLLFMFYGFDVTNWFLDLPYVPDVSSHIVGEITGKSQLGLFYVFAMSSLFFLPVPMEALHISFLRSMDASEILFIVVLGIAFGQLINYGLGRLFGFIFRSLFKKKTLRGAREKLEKYGAFAIFFVHFIPFPFQIFNVVAGTLRYPFLMWLLLMLSGLIAKHWIIGWVFGLL